MSILNRVLGLLNLIPRSRIVKLKSKIFEESPYYFSERPGSIDISTSSG